MKQAGKIKLSRTECTRNSIYITQRDQFVIFVRGFREVEKKKEKNIKCRTMRQAPIPGTAKEPRDIHIHTETCNSVRKISHGPDSHAMGTLNPETFYLAIYTLTQHITSTFNHTERPAWLVARWRHSRSHTHILHRDTGYTHACITRPCKRHRRTGCADT